MADEPSQSPRQSENENDNETSRIEQQMLKRQLAAEKRQARQEAKRLESDPTATDFERRQAAQTAKETTYSGFGETPEEAFSRLSQENAQGH